MNASWSGIMIMSKDLQKKLRELSQEDYNRLGPLSYGGEDVCILAFSYKEA